MRGEGNRRAWSRTRTCEITDPGRFLRGGSLRGEHKGPCSLVCLAAGPYRFASLSSGAIIDPTTWPLHLNGLVYKGIHFLRPWPLRSSLSEENRPPPYRQACIDAHSLFTYRCSYKMTPRSSMQATIAYHWCGYLLQRQPSRLARYQDSNRFLHRLCCMLSECFAWIL